MAGLVSGRWDLALPLGVVLELFWLDIIRLGALVPPSGVLSFLLIFSFCLLLDLQIPSQLPILFLLGLPCAYLVASLERRQRQQANIFAAAVQAWCQNPDAGVGLSPEQVVHKALWRVAWTNFGLYMACFILLLVVCLLLQKYEVLLEIPGVTWNVLYGIGLMGAVLALRTKRAYMLLTISLCAIVAWHM